MRLLYIFKDEQQAEKFAAFLSKENIDNQLEISTNTDWGSDDYGTLVCKIWVVDEDKVESAKQSLDLFLQNPEDTRFVINKSIPALVLEPFTTEVKAESSEAEPPSEPRMRKQQPMGIVTFYLLMGCVLLFFLSQITAPTVERSPTLLPLLPLFSSNIEKGLLYDYPTAYEILDKLITSYGLEQVLHPDTLPEEGKLILQQFYETPYWHGFYPKIVAYLHHHFPIELDAPMFEKIRQGEIWRLFTPVLLHNDIFHLLFNMIWLLVLGRQIEYRIGIMRYVLFILLTGVFSNTAQYLMSGSDFIGFSGILCAMISFVWFRQKWTPWEGYQLLPVTMAFITVFILGIAALQLLSFFLEVSSGSQIVTTGIANTAHLAGALLGALLAFTNLFAWQPKAG